MIPWAEVIDQSAQRERNVPGLDLGPCEYKHLEKGWSSVAFRG